MCLLSWNLGAKSSWNPQGRSRPVKACNGIALPYNTGLLKMIVGVLTTCHTQYTWDRSICIFLFNRTTLQVFVTYLTGALYVHPLWFYKHQHDNRVRSTQNAFSLPFAAILVNCAPSGEMHNYCTPHIIKENFDNFLIHRCNYILLSQVYCVYDKLLTHWGRGHLNCLNAHSRGFYNSNPLNAELNPIRYLLALLAHHFLHVSSIRVKSRVKSNKGCGFGQEISLRGLWFRN